MLFKNIRKFSRMENFKIVVSIGKGAVLHDEGFKEALLRKTSCEVDRNLTPQGRHLCACLPVKWQEDRLFGDFPSGPVVRALHFHCKGHGFDPRVRELRFPKPRGAAKRIKK